MDAPFAAIAEYEKEIEKSAAEKLQKITQRLKIPGIQPLRVLPGPAGSTSQGVQALIQYASDRKAGLIMVSSRARKGPSRWIMGSFAESLLMNSPVPVMVVKARSKIHSVDTRSILFPTDFSEGSKRAYEAALEFAGSRNAELTLFHKISYDLHAVTQTASRHSGIRARFEEIYQKLIESKKQDIAEWASLGGSRGVKVSTQLDYTMSGGAADAILKFSRKRFDMIALASTSSRLSTAILGAVSRRVMREADCPVWAVRPDRAAAKSMTQDVT